MKYVERFNDWSVRKYDGAEMEITMVLAGGDFFARNNEGEEEEFSFEDIG